MKFVDEVSIHVKAGDGGHGAIAFRREKYVERGGPSGGDGGNGGSVVLVANPQLTTLLDYRYQPLHRAKPGQNGMGSDCNGASAEDLVLQVPVGTLVKDAQSGELVADMSNPGERIVVAKGGRGGLGNMNFASSTRQTPRFAQDGTPGEERDLVLELRLLADVGLLGFPNAGKSTLISRVSRAKPKIADYPFTTLVPNLGVVQYKDGKSFVMADIPGLIEGASEGAGLGLQFLRHVERCRVLLHMVDLSAEGEGREPVADWTIINRELLRYSPELAKKPQIVVATKMDLPVARERLPDFTAAMKQKGLMVLPISAATGEGVGALLDAAARVLWGRPQEAWEGELAVARPPPLEELAAEAAPKVAPEGEGVEVVEVEEVEAMEPEAEAPEAAPVEEVVEGEVVREETVKRAPRKREAKKPARAKATAKAASPVKASAKQAAAKKSAPVKAKPAKKATVKTATAKKATAKATAKSAAKKPAAKATVKKAPARKPAKAAAKKPARASAKAAAKKPAKAGRRS